MLRSLLILLLLPSLGGIAFSVKPSPHFILAGGGCLPPTVKDKFINLAGDKKARIVIIPSASCCSDAGLSALYYFKAKVDSVEIMNTSDRHIANSPVFIQKLQNATGVWISGGDQSRLLSIYRNTLVSAELNRLIERGGVIGGTSAGASCVSKIMIFEDIEDNGFAFCPKIIVDQHFDTRNRLKRLLKLLNKHPEMIGIGLDEGTAVVNNGNDYLVIGIGSVSVCKPNGEVKVYTNNKKFTMK